MAINTVMVYVDPAQQAEGQVRVARCVATRFGASIVGVSAFAVEPDFVAEGVIIQEMTEEELKQRKVALAAKDNWFQDVVALPRERVESRWKVEYPTVFLTQGPRTLS